MKTELKQQILDFNIDRGWPSFQTPEGLAKSIVIEAAELLECYQWSSEADLDAVCDEVADVIIYAHMLVWNLGLDEDELVRRKLAKNALKYPLP